jgi:hypothetical protein
MRPFRFAPRAAMALIGLISVASLSGVSTVLAADEAADHDHSHAATASAPKPDSSAMADMMQQMQAMHAKMMAAKTPAERAALMQAHMALMQSGMSMMQGMQGASAKRMDIMQMMMDRMSTPSPDAQKPNATK